MNKTLLFLFLVLMGIWIISSLCYAVLSMVYADRTNLIDVLYQVIPIIVMIAAFGVVYYKYNSIKVDDTPSWNIKKYELLSVLGVVSLVIGLYILSSDVSFVLQAIRMNNQIDLLSIEKIMPPLVLVFFGVYYGYLHKLKRSA